MLMRNKKKRFTVEEMIEMEKELKDSELYSLGLNADDKDLSEKLKLKVEYVTDMEEDNEAELVPIEDDRYFGLIRVRKELEKYKFAYIHEIIHYIFDVGYGKKVTKCFTRKKKGKTDSPEEQQTNYKAAAYIMSWDKMTKELYAYDNQKPKMDELKFLRNMQEKYEQSEEMVIRRIREVRRMNKKEHAKIS